MSENVAITPKSRNAKACEACRASKARCVYKTQSGICQRCEQNGSECTVRAKARPMRTRAARPSDTPASVQSNVEFSLSLPTVPAPDTRRDHVALQRHHMNVLGDGGGDDDDLCPFDSVADLGQHGGPQAVVEKRKLTLIQAQALLLKFRSKASFFPFVQIPPDATVSSLSRTSPFLLLAILTAASIDDPLLHHQVEHEFRRILSSKILLQGQKSLDFLQGLLVYIAWYPVHINPNNTTSFMYMNLAINLLIDLGLDQETASNVDLSAVTSTVGLVDGENFTITARRAYLGCYYLSSAAEVIFPSLTMGYRKPNNRHYRDLLDNHDAELMQDELKTEIGSIIKLQRLCERIGDMNASKRPTLEAHLESLDDQVNIQTFSTELQEWRKTTPDHIKSFIPVSLAEKFAEISIYAHPLGFLQGPYRDVLRAMSAKQVDHSYLNNCLSAVKEYFNYLLSLPEASYLQLTTIQWGYLVQSILIASRLTFLMALNMNWGPDATRTNIPLVMYMDCLMYRFQILSSVPARTTGLPKHADMFHVFQTIFATVKKGYERRVSRLAPVPTFVPGQSVPMVVVPGHCPMMDMGLNAYFDAMDPLDEINFDLSASGTPSTGSSAATAPLFHDLWATMTGSWAEEL